MILLDRLPDELLPAISKFLFVAKDEAETNRVNIKNVSQMKEIVQSLVMTYKSLMGIQIIHDTIGGPTKCHLNFFCFFNSDFYV